MIKNISIFACLLSLYSVCAFAAKSDGEAFRADWGLGTTIPKTCVGTYDVWCNKKWSEDKKQWVEDEHCLTDNSKNFSKWNHTDWRYNWLRTRTEYSAEYYIARKITSSGAYFCKTIVAGDRRGCTHKPYTTYFDPASGTDCFWLCHEGFTGPECTKSSEVTKCADSAPAYEFMKKSNGGLQKLGLHTKGADIETDIPMFFNGEYKKCSDLGRAYLNSYKKQEHDVVLAVQMINESGDNVGYFVKPLIIRAGAPRGCEDAGDYAAWPMVEFSGANKVMCPEGWKHVDNCDNDGNCGDKLCKKTESGACSLKTPCSDFPLDKFDDKIHQKYTPKDGSCSEFRCISGAFTSKTDFTCTPCPAADVEYPQLYYVDDNGLCAACEVGEFPVDGKCVSYKDGDSKVGRIDKQMFSGKEADGKPCWAVETLDEYKKCLGLD